MNPQNSPTPSDQAPSSGATGIAEASGSRRETKPLKQAARETAAEAKAAITATAGRAREEAGRIAAERKDEAAERIDRYGSAIHDSAKSLEEKDPNIAWFTHRAADRVQQVADYLRARDLSTLRRDAEDIARRHPAVFFGGMFLAGLVLGNVVKASRRKVDARGEDARDDDSTYASEWSQHAPEHRDENAPQLTEGSPASGEI